MQIKYRIVFLWSWIWNSAFRSAHGILTVEGVLFLISRLDSEAACNRIESVFLSILVSPSIVAIEQKRENIKV